MNKILTLLILIVCYQFPYAQSNNQESTYNYDTTLKGGYSLSTRTDDSLQYLYLKRKNKTIRQLSSCSAGLPQKNLGYVAADFTHLFVLAHSFGSGNPHYIELIEKSNGKNTFKISVVWIDADEEQEFLLYCLNDSPTPKDKMALLNVKTGRQYWLEFPPDIFKEPGIINKIRIKNLTGKTIIIEYDTESGVKTKTYPL